MIYCCSLNFDFDFAVKFKIPTPPSQCLLSPLHRPLSLLYLFLVPLLPSPLSALSLLSLFYPSSLTALSLSSILAPWPSLSSISLDYPAASPPPRFRRRISATAVVRNFRPDFITVD